MDSRLETLQRYLIITLVFIVVVAIFPLTTDPSADIKILCYEVFSFIALGLWLFIPKSAIGTLRRSSALFPLFLVLLGLNLAAAFVSPNIGYSLFREFNKLAALFILFVVTANAFYTPKHVWCLIAAVCVSVSLASIYGFIQFIGIDPLPWGTPGMLRSSPATFGNPNSASHVLIPAIILASGLSTQRKGRWALLCIPLYLCHFGITQTRGSLVALTGAIFLVLVALLVSRVVHQVSRAIALTLGTVLLIAVVGVATLVTVEVRKTSHTFYDDTSLMSRLNSFYGACRMIQVRPWLGYGPGMYMVANPEYWTSSEKEEFTKANLMNFHVHNEPLEIAVDAGILAGIVYTVILAFGIYYGLSLAFVLKAPHQRPLGLALAGFFFAFLVDGFFGFNVHAPASTVLLFLIAGATAGVWRERETHSSRRAIHLEYGTFALSWRLVVLGFALIIPVLGTRDFVAKFWQQRGIGAADYTDYASAAHCFGKATLLAPYDWIPPYSLGLTAMKTNSFDEAIEYFDRTLELNPGYVNAVIQMAQAQFNVAALSSGEEMETLWDATLMYAERAAHFNPQFPDVHDFWGRVLFLYAKWLAEYGHYVKPKEVENTWKASEHQLLIAIERDSTHPDKLYQLIAETRLARGEVLGAQKALIYSLEYNADQMTTWRLFLQSSQDSKQYEAILTSLDQYIGSPRTTNVRERLRLLRARVLYSGYGDVVAAEDEFLRAVQEFPAMTETWSEFHAFAKSAHREQIFNSSLLQATTKHKNMKQPLSPQVDAVALGLSQGEDGLVKGVSMLLDVLQQHQASSTTEMTTAEVFSWAADVLSVRAQEMPLSSQNAGDVFHKLGLVYEACSDFKTAVQKFDQALPSLSGAQLFSCLFRKGEALTKIGEIEATVGTFEQLASIAPNNFEVRRGLAQAYARSGQPARARLEYQAILISSRLNAKDRTSIQLEIDALSRVVQDKDRK